ncbi:hypothetical protein N8083_01365 [Candidatus Pacebacteria bacterium]|nr:hypothetical protein [Candidatus Paceibacterota bacterium]
MKNKVIAFISNNWFKIAILVFLTLFLTKLSVLDEIANKEDLPWVDRYYMEKFHAEYLLQ